MNYVSLRVVIGSMLISAALLATLVKLTTPASSEPPTQEIRIYMRLLAVDEPTE